MDGPSLVNSTDHLITINKIQINIEEHYDIWRKENRGRTEKGIPLN